MAFRALLFSKSPETNAAMTAACESNKIRAEVCSDIFSAIEKAKTRSFSCVITDWADQPEAGFLLKRARESTANRDTLAIAIVDNEPTSAEMTDSRLDFLIYRPIAIEEADAVLAKACETMQPSSAAEIESDRQADTNGSAHNSDPEPGPDASVGAHEDGGSETDSENSENTEASVYDGERRERREAIGMREACAALLVLAALFCMWRSRESLVYLAQTPEGTTRVLRESVAALFYINQAPPVSSASSDAQQDAYFTRLPANGKKPVLAVAATESTDTTIALSRPPDFPLPEPVYVRPEVPPVHTHTVAIPESMRSSPPIAPPVVVTVHPEQMMSVSAPQGPPVIQQTGEPVTLTEKAARALLLQAVDPIYPPEGRAQKLQGPVVLQALVGRDGSVEELKIVHGYFILGRAAIAAVKQWRFQPYTLNGHAAATQTLITINFSYTPG